MKKILIGLCTLALSAGVSGAENATSPAERAIVAARISAEDAADSLYRLGRQAINDDNYERAISIFRQVVDKYPKSTPAGRVHRDSPTRPESTNFKPVGATRI